MPDIVEASRCLLNLTVCRTSMRLQTRVPPNSIGKRNHDKSLCFLFGLPVASFYSFEPNRPIAALVRYFSSRPGAAEANGALAASVGGL